MKGDAFMAIVMSMSHGEHKGMSYIDDSCVVKTKEELDRKLSSKLQRHWELL